MAPTITSRETDFFWEHKYVSVSREQVYLDAVQALRSALINKQVAYGDVYFCKVEDSITVVKQGLAYRAAYVDSIQVTGFSERKHHPTGAPRRQYDAVWMSVKYTEYYENIPDPDTVGGENRGTPLLEQISQLATAVAKYFASGRPVGGTLPTTLADIPIWPEQEISVSNDGFLALAKQDYKEHLKDHRG
jgi:hypothetical protein